MNWTRTHTGVAAALGAVALVAVAAALMAPAKDAVARTGGPAVSIAVVDPREPVPIPGGVMDVGEVVDGYQHHPYVQPAGYDPAPNQAYWDDEPLPMPASRRWTSQPPAETPPDTAVVTVRSEGRPMSFGFDEPLPDFEAQRRERQARMDRIAAEAATRVQAPSGAELDPEAEFY